MKHTQAWIDQRRKKARTIRKIIAANCREARTAQGMTQREIAELFGATEGYYRGIESGEKSFSVLRLCEIADALGKLPSDLLHGV